jgi:hypothetical protein
MYPPFGEYDIKLYRTVGTISVASEVKFLLIIVVALSSFTTHSWAQASGFGRTSPPSFGGTPGMPPPPTNPFSTVRGNFVPVHKTPDGKACINVHPTVVRQVANPNIVNHTVLVVNICAQPIKLQVCYFQRASCINVAVGGHRKIERILGISPGLSDFRFEYRELL